MQVTFRQSVRGATQRPLPGGVRTVSQACAKLAAFERPATLAHPNRNGMEGERATPDAMGGNEGSGHAGQAGRRGRCRKVRL